MCAYVCSVVSLCDPWTVAHQAPLSLEFSRQKYWSRLPFLTPGDLPNPGMETVSLLSPALAEGSFMPPGKPQVNVKKGLSESDICLIVSDSL